jgi:glycosyltransferase involved in cell wall biosynthesis
MPKISVILSCFNDGPFIADAVNSILSQDYGDFEFFVVDDISTDGTIETLRSIDDKRLTVIVNDRHLGLSRSLNVALDLARGEYIARMDGNDVSLPGRFAAQARFLDEHPEVGVTSVNMRFMDEKGAHINGGAPVYAPDRGKNGYLRWALLWLNPLAHVGIMLRRELLEQNGLRYKPEFDGAEDYEMWTRLSRLTRLERLPELFINCRLVPGSMTWDYANTYRLSTRVQGAYWPHLVGAGYSEDALKAYMLCKTGCEAAYGTLPPGEAGEALLDRAAALIRLGCEGSLAEPMSGPERAQIAEEARTHTATLAGRVDAARGEAWLAARLALLPAPESFAGAAQP